ncbi:hypothetical protein [Nocardioides albus]|uniref:Uncharacterized protein n=1 Tax=Nocardioides albus TaxID=1841 RepID=A0A7W5F953_9ACTN|nr:hypothetical protein [Nocardioides albus]MBB3089890.1 hypothetical protein [Nocardioides albus]GGU36370.1 hypothetical protein GCM10007979_39340 [Nocardioides albus]
MADHGKYVDDLIETVPWSRLTHAYDVALDAPTRLRTLASSVEAGTSEGVDDLEDWLLWSVVHQGTPYSATAPVLWIARRILGDGSTHPALGWCLPAVAESATALRWMQEYAASHPDETPDPQRSTAGQPPWATYLPLERELTSKQGDRLDDDYFLAAPADDVTLTACVIDWEQTVAECVRDRRFLDEAINAASAMVRLAPSPPLVHALRSLVNGPEDSGRRAAAAFALASAGSATGDAEALMDHDDRAIRMSAALGCPDHPRALETLVSAAADRTWVLETFPHGFAGPDPWLAPALLAAVLDRVPVDAADDRLVDGLEQQLATLPYGPFGATYEWGRILAWIFPDRWQQTAYRDVPSSGDLSNTQRRLLGALARNDDPWERGAGNASLVLGQVGLPHNRAVVTELAGVEVPRRGSWWRRS